MKRNMSVTMDRLEIDEGIRGLLRQLWKHNYRTIFSCEGHEGWEAYVAFTGGDGWFDSRASEFGLRRIENDACCGPAADVEGYRFCYGCGAGLHGITIYHGDSILDPFKRT